MDEIKACWVAYLIRLWLVLLLLGLGTYAYHAGSPSLFTSQ